MNKNYNNSLLFKINEDEMKNYIGTKLIRVIPMNREDYNKLRGWDVPNNENPMDDGYLVCYPGQTSNVNGFDGYVSWSPKEVFEQTYIELITNPELKTDKSSISQEMVDNFIDNYEIFTKQGKITIVIATLVNGFTIVESSACVSPENYDEEIGIEVCKRKIKNKVWNHLGFLLQSTKPLKNS